MKKLLTTFLAICALFTCTQAEAVEYDKKAIMKEFKCKSVDTVKYANDNWGNAITKVNRVFENEFVKITTYINIYFDYLVLPSDVRKAGAERSIILPIGGNPMMGFSTCILIAPAVTFEITNKTDKPMEIDPDHSVITICSFQGRGVQAGTKYNGAATSMQGPIMLFPNATKKVTLWRTDHRFYEGDFVSNSRWLPPFDVAPDKNLLGDMMLNINKEYITFTPEAVIPTSSLKWIKTEKKK